MAIKAAAVKTAVIRKGAVVPLSAILVPTPVATAVVWRACTMQRRQQPAQCCSNTSWGGWRSTSQRPVQACHPSSLPRCC